MDLYAVLGVRRGARESEIRRAYRRLARKYHPDVNPGDRAAEARYRQITQAYEVLLDPDRRRRYDECGRWEDTVEAASFGFAGFDFSSEPVQGAGAPTFGDLFGDVLRRPRGGSAGNAPSEGADLHATVDITFDESLRGTTRSIALQRRMPCRHCRGTGRQVVAESRCADCGGTGTVRSARGHMTFTKPCPRCGGTGRLVDAPCGPCGGQAFEVHGESVMVQIPPAVVDGERVRVAGKGDGGLHGGADGDLWVTVRVAPDPRFRRDGDDLHVVVPIAIHEAGLGAKVEVPTFDGSAQMRIPPGTQSGQRFRLRERGAPRRDGRRGDLIVEVRLMLPTLLDERSKELLREFGRIHGQYAREDSHGSRVAGDDRAIR